MPSRSTPGKFIFAEPLNDTPPIFRAVSNVVAVAAFPVTFPVILPVKVPAMAPVPVIVGDVNVLLDNSCVPVKVATVESMAISLALAFIPVPPTTFKVTSPVIPPPVKPVPAVTPSIPPRPLVNVYSTIDSPETSDIPPLTKLELNVYTELVVPV